MLELQSESVRLSMPSAVALGFFDGVHIGHREVLRQAVAYSQEHGTIPCAFTFAASSLPVKQGASLLYIYPDSQKTALLDACGIQSVYSPEFSRLCDMDGETFCRRVLKERFSAQAVFCGRDFHFGAKAAWGYADLQAFGQMYGFSVHLVEPVRYQGEVVSSTRIRRALSDGDMDLAAALLGAPYAVQGIVQHGNAFGHTKQVPTINLAFAPGQMVPRYGVYVSRTHTHQGVYPSVTNVGVRPTVSDSKTPNAESYLLNFSGNLYTQLCQVDLLYFLRDEQQFPNTDALYRQIAQDQAQAQAYFAAASHPQGGSHEES